MKINIQNLGAIKEADIELKPLTIFVGANNTGKTWTAYTIYSIFNQDAYSKYCDLYMSDKTQEKYPPLKRTIKELIMKGTAKIDVVKFFDEFCEFYFNEIAQNSCSDLSKYITTRRIPFSDLKIKIQFGSSKNKCLNSILHSQVNTSLGQQRSKNSALLKGHKEAGDPFLYFYIQNEASENIPTKVIKEFIVQNVFLVIHRSVFRYVVPFPTERTTFISIPLPSSESITRKPSQIKTHAKVQKVDNTEPDFGSSILDMMLMVMSSTLSDPSKSKYSDLANILEKDVLSGNISLSEPNPKRNLLFSPKEGVNIEISAASSMVKELTPLLLYLKNTAEEGELLIIDEPEMNLHPEAQVRLMEFIAIMVNEGLNVLITTHSPYLVDHLANLMKAAKSNNKELLKEKFLLKSSEAFISAEDVSVYLYEKGSARNIIDENGVIDWGTFGGVSDYISQLYFDID